MSFELIVALLAAAVHMGTPILFATLGEIITEKGGILNLGVEGMLGVGALAAFAASLATGSPWIGLAAGALAGAGVSLIHAFVCVTCRGNQVVSGLALTIFGLGLTEFLGTPLIGLKAAGFNALALPLLSRIPVLGPVFFRHNLLVYLSYLMPLVVWAFLKRTRTGLAVRAAGEMPEAASAAGLNPLRLRYLATLLGGLLVGVGGAYMSLAYTHLWTNNLSGGRGWIAVALVIFAFWRPGRAVYGAWLFGGVMAFQLRLQATGTDWPPQILLMLPYILTVVVLVVSALRGFRSVAPKALGVNVEPEG